MCITATAGFMEIAPVVSKYIPQSWLA